MKLTASIIMLPIMASAAWLTPSGEVFDRLPRNYGTTGNISESWALSQGWQDISDEQAAVIRCEAAGGAISNGVCVLPPQPEQSLPLPELFRDGIAVLDDDGHAIELVPVGSEVIAVQVSNSPLDPVVRERMKREGLARIETNKAAKVSTAKDIATKSQSANSIPALREELRRLAELIEQMNK